MTRALRVIMVILVLFLVAKDTLHLGDRFILRGIAQALCLAYGVLWLLKHPDLVFQKRYALIFAYLFVLVLTVFVSHDSVWSGFQVLSLTSVVLFSIAAVESSVDSDNINQLLRNVVTLTYTFACIGSIAAIWLWPEIAYVIREVTGQGRFTGLFTEPAMMGAGAGLLLGLVAYGRFPSTPMMRLVRLLAGGAAIVCLALTGARTFWIAAALAIAFTYGLYGKRRLLGMLGAGYLAITVALAIFAFDLQVTQKQIDRVARSESISTLSGRSKLWELSTEQFAKRPLLGYGYAMGGTALYEPEISRSESGEYVERLRRQGVQRPSLHNGYFQALLDSGGIGAILYISIIAVAIFRILANDTRREYGPELYVLVFLSTANLGESIIGSASVFHSILFWYTAILAMTVGRQSTLHVARDELHDTTPPKAGMVLRAGHHEHRTFLRTQLGTEPGATPSSRPPAR